ncbi:MAG: hypothetical protein WBN53_17510, partial [Thermodesulfobacteriota bacterium]
MKSQRGANVGQKRAGALSRIDTKGWKLISLEYGHHTIQIYVPGDSFEISLGKVPHIDKTRSEIERAFSNTIGSPKLEKIVKEKGKDPKEMT